MLSIESNFRDPKIFSKNEFFISFIGYFPLNNKYNGLLIQGSLIKRSYVI